MGSVPIPDFIIPYFILLLNCAFFKLLRIIVFPVTPLSLRSFISEFISTLELCSDCAELNIVWDKHGNIGYGTALLLLCLWWSQSFEDAEACPCGPIEDYIFVGSSLGSAQKLFGQIVAATVTAKYTNCFWCWHLIPEHETLHVTPECHASLQVTIIYGAIIEGIITFISRIIALESVNWDAKVASWVNSLITVTLVLSALNTTGGYFNPILASALTLGCDGNTLIEHLFVYWVGSLCGGIIARMIHVFIRGMPKDKLE